MHNFDDLVYRSTVFTLNALNNVNSKLNENLEISVSMNDVKNIQMLQLQRAILATGLFSLFDSVLQKELSCRNGFESAKKILIEKDKIELHNRFDNFLFAINVLKHGQGRSYNTLIAKSESLPFRIKLPEEKFFNEGDVSEVDTLIEVDDKFVLNCAELIEQVSKVIKNNNP